jgi:hypothetical protein
MNANGMDREREPPETAKRTSELLLSFVDSLTDVRVSISEFVSALGDRGLGVLIAVFSIPNVIPSGIPGATAIFGIPVIILGAHLAVGERRLLLPKSIGRRTMGARSFGALAVRIAKALSWFERLLRPRLTIMTKPFAEHALGVLCVVLGIVTSLPIPLGHNLPALATTLIGLGLIERDGVAILAGLSVAALGFVVATLLVLGLAHGAEFLLHDFY